MEVVVKGIRLHVDRWGSGPPLLLLHGFTGNSSNWKVFYDDWKNYSVIAINIVGHGKSEICDDMRKYDIQFFATVIHALLKKWHIDQVNVLGYSMGGRLALTFAVMYPEKIHKLIIESATPGIKDEAERAKRKKQDEKLAQYIMENGIQSFVQYWEEIPLFQSQKRLPAHVQARVRKQRLQNDPLGLSNSLRGMGTGSQPSWWDRLHLITAPTLLITGDIDEKFCHIAKEMTAVLPNGKWVSVEDAGHAIHVEKREMFGTIVSEFLRS